MATFKCWLVTDRWPASFSAQNLAICTNKSLPRHAIVKCMTRSFATNSCAARQRRAEKRRNSRETNSMYLDFDGASRRLPDLCTTWLYHLGCVFEQLQDDFMVPIYQIINISSKGMWPESENVTLVQATSREEIIKAVLRRQDSFVEKRLFPCHWRLMWDIKTFRGDPSDSKESDPGRSDPGADLVEDFLELDLGAEVRRLTEAEFVRKILKSIDDNAINDGGFYTAIRQQGSVHILNESS